MHSLRIHLFGCLELYRAGRLLPPFPTQKARELFAFLVLHRNRRYPRAVLVGTFWGEQPETSARKSLRTGIWRIRTVLEPEGTKSTPHLSVKNQDVGFNLDSAHWLDVEEFEKRIGAVGERRGPELSSAEAALLREAVELYRGDLLEGVYDDWCLYERERLRLLFISSLERLMQYHVRHDEWETAAAYGQRLLSVDPLLEQVHRELMRCYALQGNRPAALRQYAVCAELMRSELDTDATEETVALAEAIRTGRVAADLMPLWSPVPELREEPAPAEKLEIAQTRLQAVAAELDELMSTLKRVARDVDEVRAALPSGSTPREETRPRASESVR